MTRTAIDLSHRLKKLPLTRLFLFCIFFSIAATEIIVGAMGLLLKGEITYDYLLTGFFASLCVAALVSSVLIFFLNLHRLDKDALRTSEERWKFALEGAGDGVWDWNLQTGEVFFSPRCKEILGYDEDDYESRILSWESTIYPDDFQRVMSELQAHLDGDTDSYSNEHRARYKDGSWKWLLTRGKVIDRDANGKALRMIGTQTDISLRKQAEEAVQLAALVFENGSEGMVVTGADGTIVAINPSFTQLTGYTPEDVIGKNPKILQSGRQDAMFYQAMWRKLVTTGHWEGEIWNRRKNGEVYAEWLSINSIFNSDGSVNRRVALFSDITKRKQSEELIWRQANFDPLTGLPNRSMFRDRLEQAVKKTHRVNSSLALMFIDLDRFKEINDTLGHEVGDALLVDAAQRLIHCVRDTDTVARLGGDEFTVILGDLDAIDSAERIAQSILNSLAQPFQLGSERSQISASIGITFYPKDATELEDLLKNADQAMYAAKDKGRNAYCCFTPSMHDAMLNRIQLTADLREALAENQFQVYYQPIVDITTGAISKAEALIRWLHPVRGLISPDDFIALAEDTGLITEIGAWVLRTACSQAKAWRNQGQPSLRIAVNVSARQFHDMHFIDTVSAVLIETGLPPEALELEITEGMMMHNMEHTIAVIQTLRVLGVQISEDDFGTGYSSLNYLKQFPIHTLKIDKSFIRDIGSDPDDAALVIAIIAMAKSLRLSIVAEGVETEQQLAFLRDQGCTQCQGYLFAKPMPEQEFGAFLAGPRKD
ncbi:MAG: EAL domain-containing protein [Methylobacter tundripaludum]|nr:EAL domain-containing protein [Methylobacter tundripaludum]